MEGLLENVRQLSRELRQHMLIIDQFIPPEYQVQALVSFCHFSLTDLLGPTVNLEARSVSHCKKSRSLI